MKRPLVLGAYALCFMIISFAWLDYPLARFIKAHPNAGLHALMEAITALGVGYAYWGGYLALLAWCCRPLYLRKAAAPAPFLLHVAVSGLLCFTYAGIVLRLCKMMVGRVRPYYWLEHPEATFHHFINKTPFHSFPSGHTQTAFCMALILGYAWSHHHTSRFIPRALLVMAALVGISRVYLLSHFPTDVVAGALVAFVAARAAWFGKPTILLCDRLSARINRAIK